MGDELYLDISSSNFHSNLNSKREASDFQTDIGQMIMVGPFLELPDPTGLLPVQQRLQIFSCIANEPCSITLLQGRHLDNSDLIMIRKLASLRQCFALFAVFFRVFSCFCQPVLFSSMLSQTCTCFKHSKPVHEV